jgi:hypothetical protein
MNNLSWLIYLSSLVNVVQGLFIFLAIVCGIWSAICILLRTFGHPARYGDDNEATKYGKRNMKFSIPLLALFWVLAALVPDQRTVLLIAGSEIGGKVYTDPDTQEILNEAKGALRAKLKKLKE